MSEDEVDKKTSAVMGSLEVKAFRFIMPMLIVFITTTASIVWNNSMEISSQNHEIQRLIEDMKSVTGKAHVLERTDSQINEEMKSFETKSESQEKIASLHIRVTDIHMDLSDKIDQKVNQLDRRDDDLAKDLYIIKGKLE